MSLGVGVVWWNTEFVLIFSFHDFVLIFSFHDVEYRIMSLGAGVVWWNTEFVLKGLFR